MKRSCEDCEALLERRLPLETVKIAVGPGVPDQAVQDCSAVIGEVGCELARERLGLLDQDRFHHREVTGA